MNNKNIGKAVPHTMQCMGDSNMKKNTNSPKDYVIEREYLNIYSVSELMGRIIQKHSINSLNNKGLGGKNDMEKD